MQPLCLALASADDGCAWKCHFSSTVFPLQVLTWFFLVLILFLFRGICKSLFLFLPRNFLRVFQKDAKSLVSLGTHPSLLSPLHFSFLLCWLL